MCAVLCTPWCILSVSNRYYYSCAGFDAPHALSRLCFYVYGFCDPELLRNDFVLSVDQVSLQADFHIDHAYGVSSGCAVYDGQRTSI